MDIAHDDIAALKGKEISYELVTKSVLFELKNGLYSDQHTVAQVSAKSSQVQNNLPSVKFTGNLVNHDGEHYNIKSDWQDMVAIKGTAEGLAAKEGDTVTLTINGHTVSTTLDTDRHFTANVDRQWLKGGDKVQATLKAHDAQNVEIQVHTQEHYTDLQDVNGNRQIEWVDYHIKAPDEPKMEYVAEVLENGVYDYYIKPHIGNYEQHTGFTKAYRFAKGQYTDETKAVIRSVLDKISDYTDLTFHESNSLSVMPYTAGSIIERYGAIGFYNLVQDYIKLDTSMLNNPESYQLWNLVLHETLHSLGTKHPHDGETHRLLNSEEDMKNLTVMSYVAFRMSSIERVCMICASLI